MQWSSAVRRGALGTHDIAGRRGEPAEESTYTIADAPTKGWNHAIIFSVYPKDDPDNRAVVIKEYAWKQNDFKIRACCHQVNGSWIVMGANKIQNDVKF